MSEAAASSLRRRKERLCTGTLLAVAVCCSSAAAQPLTVLTHEYEPLMYSARGVVTGCGIGFTVVTSGSVGIQGSVNLFSPPGKISAISFKLTVYRDAKDELRSMPVSYAWVRTGGYTSTKGFSEYPTDTPGAFFAGTTDVAAFYLLSGIFDNGISVGFTPIGKDADDTFHLPPLADVHIAQAHRSCVDEILARE